MKKVFAISIGLFVLTLLFLGVYNFAFKNNPNNPTVDEQVKKEAKEETDKGFLDKLTSAPVEKITDTDTTGGIALSGTSLAYFTGKSLKKSSLGGGAEETIVESLPGNVLRATWSPDKKQALALLATAEGQRWYLIRIEDKSFLPLKAGLASPSWANIGEKIFYFYTDPGNGQTGINTANPDGSEWKEIGKAPFANPFIATVPNSALISFWNRPNGHEETALYTIPASGGEPKRIFSGKYGGNYLWSPNGERLLVSSVSEKSGANIGLGISNGSGGEYRTLQVPTLVSKTVWSKDNKTIYYALPTSKPENIVLPNDYFDRPIYTADLFWKIDADTGKSDRIIKPEDIGGEFDSIDLFLDPKEEYLFFTNRKDKKLYRIQL